MGHALTEPVKRRKKWKARPWLILAVALLAAFALHRWLARPFQAPPTAPKPRAGWFLILRMPELQHDPVGRAAGQGRLAQWLDALDQAGYRTMFLSEAVAQARRGEPFPERSVVLLYMPAARQTVEEVLPLLASHHFSATLVMPLERVDSEDMSYLSRHRLAELQDLGYFDLGFFGASSMTFTLRPSRRSPAPQAEMPLAWDPMAERNIINMAGDTRTLSRLNVNLVWTGAQMIQRLAAETPIRARARLTSRRLFRKNWGVAAEADAPFDIQAEEGSRGATVTWRGSRGLKDLRIDISAAEVRDELWAYFRYDHATETGWRVGFTPERVTVEEIAGEAMNQLMTEPRAAGQDRSLKATITLQGSRLSVAAAGARPRAVDLAAAALPTQALFGVSIYSKIRAVAMARAVSIMATPLPE